MPHCSSGCARNPSTTAGIGRTHRVFIRLPIATAGPRTPPPPPAGSRLPRPPAVVLYPLRQHHRPVRRVSPDLRQARQSLADSLEHLHGSVSVSRRGRQHDQAPDQADGINQHMPLAAGDLFPPVVPFRAARLGRLHRLGVHDARTRCLLAVEQSVDVTTKRVV